MEDNEKHIWLGHNGLPIFRKTGMIVIRGALDHTEIHSGEFCVDVLLKEGPAWISLADFANLLEAYGCTVTLPETPIAVKSPARELKAGDMIRQINNHGKVIWAPVKVLHAVPTPNNEIAVLIIENENNSNYNIGEIEPRLILESDGTHRYLHEDGTDIIFPESES